MPFHIIKLKRFLFVGLISWVALLTSCFPKNNKDEPECISCDKSDCEIILEVKPFLKDSTTIQNLNYSLIVSSLDGTQIISSHTANDGRIKLNVPLGKYKVLAFAQPLKRDGLLNYSLNKMNIEVDEAKTYIIGESHRIVYAGENNLNVSYRTKPLTITLEPMVGQFKIIADDTPDYEVEDIKISFGDSIPSGFNLFTKTEQAMISIKNLSSNISNFSKQVEICDNVLMTRDSFSLPVKVEVFTKNNRRASVVNLLIPLKRDACISISGKIFTSYDPDYKGGAGGGLGIDWGFDSEHEVWI